MYSNTQRSKSFYADWRMLSMIYKCRFVPTYVIIVELWTDEKIKMFLTWSLGKAQVWNVFKDVNIMFYFITLETPDEFKN